MREGDPEDESVVESSFFHSIIVEQCSTTPARLMGKRACSYGIISTFCEKAMGFGLKRVQFYPNNSQQI
jgi:hypothetical protein